MMRHISSFAACFVALTAFAAGQSAGSKSSVAGLPLRPVCVADPGGPIDFQGHLGRAGGNSTVKILRATDASELYVDSIAGAMGSSSAPPHQIQTIAEFEDIERQISRVPATLAAAQTAYFVSGDFKCIGFTPGRYIFLSEVYGGAAKQGDAPGAIAYYRADVDVSSIRRHATVVVRDFHLIGSYPPGT